MKGVLVYPCLGLHRPDVGKASIARLVEEGKASGKTNFPGVVLSLEHVILTKVSLSELVQHNQIKELVPSTDDNPVPRWNKTRATETSDTEKGASESQEESHENSQDVQENGEKVTEAVSTEKPLGSQQSEHQLAKRKTVDTSWWQQRPSEWSGEQR